MQDIRPHPQFPFIEIGKHVDYTEADSGCDFHDEWCFRIDGNYGYQVCADEKEAVEAAERKLFKENSLVVEKFIQQSIKNNDYQLLIALAERQGFWKGIETQRKAASLIIKKAQAIIEPLSRL